MRKRKRNVKKESFFVVIICYVWHILLPKPALSLRASIFLSESVFVNRCKDILSLSTGQKNSTQPAKAS